MNSKCLVCHQDAEFERLGNRDADLYKCKRCGLYMIDRTTKHWIQSPLCAYDAETPTPC